MKPIFSYAGIGGVIIGVIVIIISILITGHRFLDDYLSRFTLEPTSLLFSIGMAITGLLLLLFYIGLFMHTCIWRKAGSIAGIISAIGLFLSIIYPSGLDMHMLAAQILFIMAGVSVALLTISYRKEKIVWIGIIAIISSLVLFFYVTPFTEKITAIILGLWILGLSITEIKSHKK